MKNRPKPKDHCIFCGAYEELSREHVLPDWMKPHLPGYEGVYREGKLFLRDMETGIEQAPQIVIKNGSGQHRSQTLKVVCGKCNGVWMSQIVQDAKPALELIMQGQWVDLSEQVQQKISIWFTLHNIVYEQYSKLLQVTSDADKQKFMADRDPGSRRFIWMAKIHDDRMIPTFARFLGTGNPNSSSQKVLILAIAIGETALISVNDPSGIVNDEKIQKIEKMLSRWSLRIWPSTVNAVEPTSIIQPDALYDFLKDIERIIAGGESRLESALAEFFKELKRT